ncbi:hypothetical protein C8R45DRAFT_1113435 [Mycena sanguinolenta]|nr:hypothetical protein C8R45DRAFT_1113435 [Mycena sanguinolenta]
MPSAPVLNSILHAMYNNHDESSCGRSTPWMYPGPVMLMHKTHSSKPLQFPPDPPDASIIPLTHVRLYLLMHSA